MNKLSKIFQPISVIPKNAVVKNHDITSKSQKVVKFTVLPAACAHLNLIPRCIFYIF